MTLKRWEHRLKDFGFRGIARRAPGPISRPTAADLRAMRKILVVRLDDRIGNAVLLSPLLISLQGIFSPAKVFCLLSKRFFGLSEFLPSVERFIAYDKRAYARNPLRLWRLLRSLQKEEFDLVIDASDELELSFNHAVTTAFSGGRFRVGYDRQGSSRWLEVSVPPGDPTRHAVEMYLDLLRAITPVHHPPRPMLDVSAINSFGADFRQANRIAPGEPLVVIHPGGHGPKRWALQRFFQVAERIGDRLSARPVFVWGPAESETIAAARDDAPGGITWAGVLPFADLISLLHAASAYLSNDNGIMHLATACGVPTIGIFVVSNIDKYRPLGALDRAFDESAAPVKTGEIIEALRGILEETMVDATVVLPSRDKRSDNTAQRQALAGD